MLDPARILYLHGLDSSGQTYKARLVRSVFPDLIAPDFTGTVEQRMAQLEPILGAAANWTLIGSSLGGLMAALFATRHPTQVRKLLLLAPALMLPEFSAHPPPAVDIPTVIVHGRQDVVVPPAQIRPLAEAVFRVLTYQIVDDDHRLHRTAETLDWKALIE